MENPEEMASYPFGDEHVSPPIVEYRCPVRKRTARMYEFGPLQLDEFMVMIGRHGYAMFRRFGAMQVNQIYYKKLGNKTRGKRLTTFGDIAAV